MKCDGRTIRHRRGFTAVEILIVVAAMAIMAGIVVPQVGESIEQAKESTMLANLHMLTTAIERYKIDHEGLAPEIFKGSLPELTQPTDLFGNIGKGPDYIFGPYLMDGLPVNPINDDAKVYEALVSPPKSPETRTGWLYYAPTGQLWAGEKRER